MSPIQVLHGQPTPEELATVLAVVQARAAAAQAAALAAPRGRRPGQPVERPREAAPPGPAARAGRLAHQRLGPLTRSRPPGASIAPGGRASAPRIRTAAVVRELSTRTQARVEAPGARW
ncbi:acyl-CoA carboxylase epsilon subunit [Kitasatospora terrestris]|uniref:Acyl-CoA carboxylase subunit epsilon n=1 Tax=Kitasatospora terrestris TaxID=258051 RepID=A0ABP9DNR7_9ACTN